MWPFRSIYAGGGVAQQVSRVGKRFFVAEPANKSARLKFVLGHRETRKGLTGRCQATGSCVCVPF